MTVQVLKIIRINLFILNLYQCLGQASRFKLQVEVLMEFHTWFSKRWNEERTQL